MFKKLNKKGHLIPVPVGFNISDIFNFIILTIPFIVIYFWHIWHDHKHNDKLTKRLDEIISLLKKSIEKKKKDE